MRQAVEVYRKATPDTWERFRAESLLGATLAGQKRYAEAEPLLLAAYSGLWASTRAHLTVVIWTMSGKGS